MSNYNNNIESNRETGKMTFGEIDKGFIGRMSTIFLFAISMSLAFLLAHLSPELIDSIAYAQLPHPLQGSDNDYDSDLGQTNSSSPIISISRPNSSLFNDVFKQTQGSVVQITRTYPNRYRCRSFTRE